MTASQESGMQLENFKKYCGKRLHHPHIHVVRYTVTQICKILKKSILHSQVFFYDVYFK